MSGKKGYEQIYDWVCGDLAKANLAECAPRLGLKMDENSRVIVPFFGRDYLVDNSGVTTADGRPAEFTYLSVIGHYAMSQGHGEPAGHFLPMWRLSGTVETGGSFECSAISNPLNRRFGNNLEALHAKALSLGGEAVKSEPSGGLAWVFHPFPKVAMKLFHQPADDEFEADYQVLFDITAPNFMQFEALAFVAGIFVDEMSAE